MRYMRYFEDLDWSLKGDLPIDYLNGLFSFIDEYPSNRVGIYPHYPDEHPVPFFKSNFGTRGYGYAGRGGGMKYLSVRIMVDSTHFTIVSDQIKSIKDVLESEDILLEYEVWPYNNVIRDKIKRTEYKFDISIYKM